MDRVRRARQAPHGRVERARPPVPRPRVRRRRRSPVARDDPSRRNPALVGDGRHALVDDVLDVVLRHDPSDALVDAAFDLLDAISHVGAGSHGSGAAEADNQSGEADDRSVVPFSATDGNLRRLARAVEPSVAERRPAVTLRALQTLRGYVEGDAVDEDAEMTESEARAAARRAAERSRAAWRALTRDEEDEDEDEEDEDRDDERLVEPRLVEPASASGSIPRPGRPRVSDFFAKLFRGAPRAGARARGGGSFHGGDRGGVRVGVVRARRFSSRGRRGGSFAVPRAERHAGTRRG